jgi:hypothetical protein
MKYQTEGKWNARHPLKRLLDCCIEAGAGHKAQVSESIMMTMMILKMSVELSSLFYSSKVGIRHESL